MKKIRTRLSAKITPTVGLIPDRNGKKPAAKQPVGPFNPQTYLATNGQGKTTVQAPQKHLIFSQGDAATAVFYLKTGRVKLSVLSPQGKEAVVAMLEGGAFWGESCLAGQTVRPATAIAVEDSRLVRIDKEVMIRLLHEEPAFSELFLTHLLSRNMRIQEDVVDHLFNSSEKRLARVLLLLAHCEKDGRTEASLPKLSQETLARVSFFMTRFRGQGFLLYDNGGWHMHRSLYNVIRHGWHSSYG